MRHAWIAILFLLGPTAAGAAEAAAPARPATLQQRAERLLAACDRAAGGTAGVSVVDLATGRAVVALRDDRLFLPASNQKLLTSAFALLRLGGGFRFVTGVFDLDGDVLVAGDGDPTLGDPRLADEAGTTIYAELDRWAAAVRQKAGAEVRDLLLCESPDVPLRHPDWPASQKDRWYAAPVSTLNFHNNCFDVVFVRASGQLVPVVRPEGRYFRVVNRLRPGGKNLWALHTSDGEQTVTLTGTVARPSDEEFNTAVDHPALLLGRTFADRLVRAGVAVRGRIRRVGPRAIEWSRARPVCQTETPLSVAMYRANKRSLNMAAEAIFLRAGDGTWAGSAEMMTATLTKAFGLPPGSIASSDGGGLGRRNRVAPAAMTRILAGLARRDDVMVLLASLPIGGVDGTLERRFADPPCRGRVLGKTGYIAGVSALSGYVLDGQRRVRMAFSVLVNDIRGGTAPAKDLQEGICRLLIDAMDAEAAAPGRRPVARSP